MQLDVFFNILQMILLLMGMKEATATHSCVWCTVSKDKRLLIKLIYSQLSSQLANSSQIASQFMPYLSIIATIGGILVFMILSIQSHKNVHYNHFMITTEKKIKDANTQLPLIKLDPDNIIPDELHLLLRITDVLIHNLIIAAKTSDKKTNRRLELKEGPMIKALIGNIQSCGVSINIWEKADGKIDFTSIMGDDKKKLLKMLPPRLISCQPSAFASDVKKLWEVASQFDITWLQLLASYNTQLQLYSFMTS